MDKPLPPSMTSHSFFDRPCELRMFTAKFQAEFRRVLKTATYKKDEVWLAAGSVGHELGMIETGCAIGLRDNMGTSCVCKLYPTHSILLPSASIFQDEPSKISIRFLMDTLVYTLSARSLQVLTSQYDEAVFINNFFMADETARAEELSFVLAQLYPDQRLEYVLEHYGDVFNLLTRDQQASFLGISIRTMIDLL